VGRGVCGIADGEGEALRYIGRTGREVTLEIWLVGT
jgi:hypothetical protein